MKLFLDTAHLSDIRTAREWGILDGVTITPTLAAREGLEFAAQGYDTQVLAASPRHPVHVVEAARMGADCATMPFAVMESLFHHPLTDIGMARFNADWDAYQRALAAKRG